MPTSARGSEPARRAARGFSLIELLVVLALVGLSAALITVSWRPAGAAQLDEEAARLAALLEGARAEAQAAGLSVRWVPAATEAPQTPNGQRTFQFVGLPARLSPPTQWLHAGVRAQVDGAVQAVVLGPEPILPPLSIGLGATGHRLRVATDGLRPFAVRSDSPDGGAP